MRLKLYSISFDLLQPGDYATLKERLRVVMGASQILEHQWALRSHLTAAQLREDLRGLIAENDRVVVTQIGGEFATRRALRNLAEL